MFKTIALIGLAAALAVPPASAFAVSGNSSSYGSDGSGPTDSHSVADALRPRLEPQQSVQI